MGLKVFGSHNFEVVGRGTVSRRAGFRLCHLEVSTSATLRVFQSISVHTASRWDPAVRHLDGDYAHNFEVSSVRLPLVNTGKCRTRKQRNPSKSTLVTIG